MTIPHAPSVSFLPTSHHLPKSSTEGRYLRSSPTSQSLQQIENFGVGLRNSWCSIFFNPICLNLPWILFSLCCFYFLFTILINHLRSRIHKVSLRLWASVSSKDQKVKHQNRSVDISDSKSKALMIGFKCYWINNLKKKPKHCSLSGLGLWVCVLAMKSHCSLAHGCSGSGAVCMALLKEEMEVIEDPWSVKVQMRWSTSVPPFVLVTMQEKGREARQCGATDLQTGSHQNWPGKSPGHKGMRREWLVLRVAVYRLGGVVV